MGVSGEGIRPHIVLVWRFTDDYPGRFDWGGSLAGACAGASWPVSSRVGLGRGGVSVLYYEVAIRRRIAVFRIQDFLEFVHYLY